MTARCDVCDTRPATRTNATSSAGDTNICDECSRGVYPGTRCACRDCGCAGTREPIQCHNDAMRMVTVRYDDSRGVSIEEDIPFCEVCAQHAEYMAVAS
jgi:hypothetical protein